MRKIILIISFLMVSIVSKAQSFNQCLAQPTTVYMGTENSFNQYKCVYSSICITANPNSFSRYVMQVASITLEDGSPFNPIGGIVTDSLVARFDMNEGTGGTTTDSVNSIVGTLYLYTWQTSDGKPVKCLSFTPGSSPGAGGIVLDYNAVLNFTSACSYQFWVKTSETCRLLNCDDVGGHAKFQIAIYASDLTANFVDSSYVNHVVTVPWAAYSGIWTNIAAVFTGSTGKIYINGSYVSETDTVTSLCSLAYPYNIGCCYPTYGRYYGANSRMDSFYFYNKALSDAEVLQNYNAGNP